MWETVERVVFREVGHEHGQFRVPRRGARRVSDRGIGGLRFSDDRRAPRLKCQMSGRLFARDPPSGLLASPHHFDAVN